MAIQTFERRKHLLLAEDNKRCVMVPLDANLFQIKTLLYHPILGDSPSDVIMVEILEPTQIL